MNKKNKILNLNFKRFSITPETIEEIHNHPQFYWNLPIRVQMGKIYTDEEFQKRSDKVLKKKLP